MKRRQWIKRLTSMILSLIFVLSISVSAFASEEPSYGGYEIVPEEITEFELTASDVRTEQGKQVFTFVVSVPADGKYYELTDFIGEYTEGSTITISGTWGPAYANLAIMFKDTVNGGSVESPYICEQETASFGLWRDSTWSLYIRANNQNLSGAFRIEVTV